MALSSVETQLTTFQAELDNLSARLVEREMQLATLQQEIRRFEAEYQTRIGPYYLRLDELNAELWERRAAVEPLDEGLQTAAAEARVQAEATRAGVEAAKSEGVPPRVELSDDIRKQFRKAAMRLHPDRAIDEADRQRREHWMARLNAAYTRGDGAGIEAVIADFEQSPEAVPGEGVEAQLERARRQTATLQRHIDHVERELAELEASASNQLRRAFLSQAGQGLEPYAVLIADIEERIAGVETELHAITAKPKTVETRRHSGETHRNEPNLNATESPAEPRPPFHPEGLKHRTDRGEKVRSKSEVIIANALHRLGVNYAYERGFTADDGSLMLPDFTAFDSDNNPLVWEHLGMLHQATYAQRWEEKLACYQANGFTLGVNLFVTRDEADGSLDSSKISRVAKFIHALTEEA